MSPALCIVFPIVITPTILVAMLCPVWLLSLRCVCICKSIACMYVTVSSKRVNSRGTSVVVCTDLRGNELHGQVGVGIGVMSVILHGVMVAHWPGKFESFHHTHDNKLQINAIRKRQSFPHGIFCS